MKTLEVVDWLLERGVQINVSRSDGTTSYSLANGFYKSDGSARLVDGPEGRCELHCRYQEVTEVSCPWDVVRCSLKWHDYSAGRFDGWRDPAEPWASLYQRLSEREDSPHA